MSPARLTAFQVLLRVHGGGFASDLLMAAWAGLDSRDAGLASEIVFGILRYQAQLDYLIAHYSGRGVARLDLEVRIALQIGLYQIRYLDRIPPHAAVAESVELVKRSGKRSAAGFANAVLRKADRRPVEWPDRATELSMPAWLLARWDRHYGPETASGIARAFLRPPETYLRVPPGASHTLDVEATEIPGCMRLLSGGSGSFRRQDIGSQWVVTLLNLEPGHSFLDLCAAPGNKTAQALETVRSAVACDRVLSRLHSVDGLACGRVVLDAARPLPFRKRFNRILLDAPCSGTGTIGRNPEIKWRLQEPALAGFHARQAAMLSEALRHLAPGGLLVYSTCSLEAEENEGVVEEVLGSDAGVEVVTSAPLRSRLGMEWSSVGMERSEGGGEQSGCGAERLGAGMERSGGGGERSGVEMDRSGGGTERSEVRMEASDGGTERSGVGMEGSGRGAERSWLGMERLRLGIMRLPAVSRGDGFFAAVLKLRE